MTLELVEAAALLRFDPRAGWPDTFTGRQLASLQAHKNGVDTSSRAWAKEVGIWESAMWLGIDNGTLRGTETTGRRASWCHITAPDFAAFLAHMGEQPARLVAAWFKADGVQAAAPAQASPMPRAPAKGTTPKMGPKRQDLLTPLIRQAMRESGDSASPAAVFNVMREWAKQQNPPQPLFGVTDSGIQWVGADDAPRELSINALRARIQRTKETESAR